MWFLPRGATKPQWAWIIAITAVVIASGRAWPADAAPAAQPNAEPAPACSERNRDAIVTHFVTPVFPPDLRSLSGGPYTVLLRVTIDENGDVVDASVGKSSGYKEMDQAALASARKSTYLPKIVNCVPVSYSYLFRDEFRPRE